MDLFIKHDNCPYLNNDLLPGYSYKDLLIRTLNFTAQIKGKYKNVLVFLPNCVEYIECIFSCILGNINLLHCTYRNIIKYIFHPSIDLIITCDSHKKIIGNLLGDSNNFIGKEINDKILLIDNIELHSNDSHIIYKENVLSFDGKQLIDIYSQFLETTTSYNKFPTINNTSLINVTVQYMQHNAIHNYKLFYQLQRQINNLNCGEICIFPWELNNLQGIVNLFTIINNGYTILHFSKEYKIYYDKNYMFPYELNCCHINPFTLIHMGINNKNNGNNENNNGKMIDKNKKMIGIIDNVSHGTKFYFYTQNDGNQDKLFINIIQTQDIYFSDSLIEPFSIDKKYSMIKYNNNTFMGMNMGIKNNKDIEGLINGSHRNKLYINELIKINHWKTYDENEINYYKLFFNIINRDIIDTDYIDENNYDITNNNKMDSLMKQLSLTNLNNGETVLYFEKLYHRLHWKDISKMKKFIEEKQLCFPLIIPLNHMGISKYNLNRKINKLGFKVFIMLIPSTMDSIIYLYSPFTELKHRELHTLIISHLYNNIDDNISDSQKIDYRESITRTQEEIHNNMKLKVKYTINDNYNGNENKNVSLRSILKIKDILPLNLWEIWTIVYILIVYKWESYFGNNKNNKTNKTNKNNKNNDVSHRNNLLIKYTISINKQFLNWETYIKLLDKCTKEGINIKELILTLFSLFIKKNDNSIDIMIFPGKNKEDKENGIENNNITNNSAISYNFPTILLEYHSLLFAFLKINKPLRFFVKKYLRENLPIKDRLFYCGFNTLQEGVSCKFWRMIGCVNFEIIDGFGVNFDIMGIRATNGIYIVVSHVLQELREYINLII